MGTAVMIGALLVGCGEAPSKDAATNARANNVTTNNVTTTTLTTNNVTTNNVTTNNVANNRPTGPYELTSYDELCDGHQMLTGNNLIALLPASSREFQMQWSDDMAVTLLTLTVTAPMAGTLTCTPEPVYPENSGAQAQPATLTLSGVTLLVTTEDGRLNDTLAGTATIDGFGSELVNVSADIASSELSGEWRPTYPETTDPTLHAQALFSGQDGSGVLAASPDPPGMVNGWSTIASWPTR